MSSSNTDPSSSSSSNPNRVLTLKSSDNEHFEIKESVAKQSGVLKLMIEDECFQGEIPLNNVSGKFLSKVIDWCNKHHQEEKEEGEKGKRKVSDEYMKTWEKDFMESLSMDELFEMLLASNYLDVYSLLDCAAERAADLMKGKTPEEIRITFNITNDFTEEEEAQIRKENEWAFSPSEPVDHRRSDTERKR